LVAWLEFNVPFQNAAISETSDNSNCLCNFIRVVTVSV